VLNYISDTWKEILNSARNTVSKNKTSNYPSNTWKTSILISEHSPIRKLVIDYTWKSIKSWISVHFCRHKFGVDHFVSTQRDDRTSIDRDKSTQDTKVSHNINLNAQAIINISRKRLCINAHKETREKWKEFLESFKKDESELYFVCVPECVYRCGCPEFKSCGYWDKFVNTLTEEELTHIHSRYSKYSK